MNKISSKNELVDTLIYFIGKIFLSDNIWVYYGFSKRPKVGKFFCEKFPKHYELLNYLNKEIITLSFIDVVTIIKKANLSYDNKILIIMGVIDRIASLNIYELDDFINYFLIAYDDFTKNKDKKITAPIFSRAKDKLNDKNFIKFTKGTLNISETRNYFTNECYFLNYDIIKNHIKNSKINGRLKMESLSEMDCRKYFKLLEKKNIF